jgi:hypothetical protein
MKLNKQKRLSKWPVPLLFILIGGSIFLLVGGFVLHHYINAAQTQDILPANTSSSVSTNAFSIQAHAITPTAGHSHDKTPGKPTKQPSLSSTPGVSSTTPSGSIGNNNIALPPGSALPSDSTCASHVNYSAFEPRPDNYAADHRVPSAAQIANLHPWNPLIGMDDKSDSLRRRVTGNFIGTTDEILQWVACKWGIDVNIIRAEAVTESTWHQSQLGDYTTNQSLCPPGTWNGSSCYQSYGILQIKYTYFQSEWPMSRDDTAFNADFVYGWLRNCYEGWADYLYQSTPAAGYARYHAGDIWGCLGFWFSGTWYDQGAINYINVTKGYYTQEPWLKPGF